MVQTFGNEIVGGYTNGVPLKAIYNNGVLVWENTSFQYYIQWTPSDLSEGTFTINGNTYNFSDYSGYFTDFSGYITKYAFMGTQVVSIDTNATGVGRDIFKGCGQLTTVNMQSCSSIYLQGFYNCPNLQSVSLPVCKIIGLYAFGWCSSLTEVYFPECSVIDPYAFQDCYSLSRVILPKCNIIYPGAFYSCRSLDTVILDTSSVCDLVSDVGLASDNPFFGTPIDSGTGRIYVPASLLSDYKKALNWSSYSSQIYPIQ